MVDIAHRQCKWIPWLRHTQHRLSFSRAEVVLLNSWMPEQQIIYNLLRVFVKTVRFTDSANNSGGGILCNYHIKTLMLWACELKPRRQWIGNFNAIRISVKLLHTLAAWLTEARCPHYFISDCNLFDVLDDSAELTASILMSVTQPWLLEWFIHNYLRRCADLCPAIVSRLFDDVSTSRKLQTAVSAVVRWRSRMWPIVSCSLFMLFQHDMANCVSRLSPTVRSCLYLIKELPRVDHILSGYYTALTFLHVCYRIIRNSLSDGLLDALSTLCLQSNDARRCLRAQHSSVLSLRQAAVLMKVVATNSHSTVQLIEIELAKAYLHRALRCKDSDIDSVYCPANVYLAVLNFTTGQYQTAIDHCTLALRSRDHSQCSSQHVVQGELIPKIDDMVDIVLGLAVFYQFIRISALDRQQRTQNVNVFTTELFAHYLHMRCLSVQKYETSSTDPVWRYQKYFFESTKMFICDVLLFRSVNRTKYSANYRRLTVVREYAEPVTASHLDTSKLVQLLQQSAIEHLTRFRELEAQRPRPCQVIVTTEFEALYAYKRGEYQHCFSLAVRNVRKLTAGLGMSEVRIYAYPELIQLMDDELASVIGLSVIVHPSRGTLMRHVSIHQLSLCLYLMTQCQIKLNHSLESLALTLNYVALACRHPQCALFMTLDELILKLIERKIKMRVGRRASHFHSRLEAHQRLYRVLSKRINHVIGLSFPGPV